MRPPPDETARSPAGEAVPSLADVAALVGSWPEQALHMEIGLRAETLRLDPTRVFCLSVVPAPPSEAGVAFPGLERLGERLVHRLARQIEELIAGDDPLDELERCRLLGAARLAEREASAEIASALVAGFGLAPSIAPLAAAALYRRGAPARWPDLPALRRRAAISAIERLATPK